MSRFPLRSYFKVSDSGGRDRLGDLLYFSFFLMVMSVFILVSVVCLSASWWFIFGR